MVQLQHRDFAAPAPLSTVGESREWARDLGTIGAVSGALAPGLVIFNPGFSLMAGVAGLISGVAIGAVMPRLLGFTRRWVPLSLHLGLAPVAGAAWGGAVGAFGGLGISSFGLMAGAPVEAGVGLGAVFGALAGAVQVGWMALPYLLVTVLRMRKLPVVGLACLLAPALGWVALLGFLTAFSPLLLVWPLLYAAVVGVALWAERRWRRTLRS